MSEHTISRQCLNFISSEKRNPRIARVIMTFRCNRKCHNCCNTHQNILDQGIHFTNIDHAIDLVKNYETVLLTGGEPMLNVFELYQWIKQLKLVHKVPKLYLYSAFWPGFSKTLEQIFNLLDGVHFTLHAKATYLDIEGFSEIQRAAAWYNGRNGKTWRAYIDPEVGMTHIPIVPRAWSRLEIKPWQKECSLPVNEDLFLPRGDSINDAKF